LRPLLTTALRTKLGATLLFGVRKPTTDTTAYFHCLSLHLRMQKCDGQDKFLSALPRPPAGPYAVEEEMEVRSAIQQIALEHRRRYGYRRITAELHRRGMQINHKRVVRIMREDNLLGLPPKRFKVTTDSNHKFEVYLNLAARMRLSGINQLWVADITYIRLKAEFVYLAVILDGFSRKVVGWALDRTLAVRLTLGALEQALDRRQPEPGLVHHSDRGFQYAHAEYVAILEKHRMVPSMSRPANPYDNASCESFMKTLKREEIYANKYDDG